MKKFISSKLKVSDRLLFTPTISQCGTIYRVREWDKGEQRLTYLASLLLD